MSYQVGMHIFISNDRLYYSTVCPDTINYDPSRSESPRRDCTGWIFFFRNSFSRCDVRRPWAISISDFSAVLIVRKSVLRTSAEPTVLSKFYPIDSVGEIGFRPTKRPTVYHSFSNRIRKASTSDVRRHSIELTNGVSFVYFTCTWNALLFSDTLSMLILNYEFYNWS